MQPNNLPFPALGGAGAGAPPDDDLHFPENSFRVRAPGLDMQPGDFRHLTMRESYRSIVKGVWEATNATPDAWNRLAEMDINAIEGRRLFGELAGDILGRAGPFGGGEYEFAHDALCSIIIKIAKLGWQGYMESEIAGRAGGLFIPSPLAPPVAPVP